MLLGQENPRSFGAICPFPQPKEAGGGQGDALGVCRGGRGAETLLSVFGVFPGERNNSPIPESQTHRDGSVVGSQILPGWL